MRISIVAAAGPLSAFVPPHCSLFSPCRHILFDPLSSRSNLPTVAEWLIAAVRTNHRRCELGLSWESTLVATRFRDFNQQLWPQTHSPTCLCRATSFGVLPPLRTYLTSICCIALFLSVHHRASVAVTMQFCVCLRPVARFGQLASILPPPTHHHPPPSSLRLTRLQFRTLISLRHPPLTPFPSVPPCRLISESNNMSCRTPTNSFCPPSQIPG